MKMISLKSAPRWLMIANAFVNALFCLPILMLYYGFKGVSIGDFFLIQGISWIFVFFIEVPSGYIGDLFSRKNTVILGSAIWIVGYLFWIFGFGFWFILAGELSFALAIALVSGTIEAYLYDLLKKRHKEDLFHKKLAKMETVSNIGLLTATLSGAFLYQFFSPDTPIWCSVFCVAAGVGIMCLLPDVPESKRQIEENKSKLKDILDISKFAMKHKEIKWLMLYSSLYGMLTLILMWGSQSVMVERALPVFMFSVIAGLNAFVRTAWSSISGPLLDKRGLSGVIAVLCGVIIFSTFAACSAVYVPQWTVYACLIFMVLGSGSVVLAHIATSTLINHRIRSDERATVLSVNSMINRAFMGIGMVCLKPLFDNLGIGQTFMISALLLIPILLCSYRLVQMKLKLKK